MGECHLCPPDDAAVDDQQLVDHLRAVHPDAYGDGPERWPDGAPVVEYDVSSPADLEDGAR